MKTNDETVLIDERKLVKQFVEMIQEKNKVLTERHRAKDKEMGTSHFFDGLTIAHCSEGMGIEGVFKNLLATYNNNYSESIFYQCDNIRMRQIIEGVNSYLSFRGLENDYLLYKQARENFKGRGKPKTVKQLTTKQGELN